LSDGAPQAFRTWQTSSRHKRDRRQD